MGLRPAAAGYVDAFVAELDGHLEYYCEGLVKKSQGWMSPNECRRSMDMLHGRFGESSASPKWIAAGIVDFATGT